MEAQPGGKAAARVFLRQKAASAHRVVDAAYGDDRTPGQHRATMETAVRFTKEEAVAFSEELGDLLQRWSERNRGRDDGRMHLPGARHGAAPPGPLSGRDGHAAVRSLRSPQPLRLA